MSDAPALTSMADFPVALNRGLLAAQENSMSDPHLGYLALGGAAPVPATHKTATVPVQMYSIARKHLF
jgi:hypothetical protein